MARLHVPPQEPCSASALVHMCHADGHGACCCSSSVRAPCMLTAQPICMFTTAIWPRLMNVCSQKHGEMRKMEVKNLRKHVQRRQKKCNGCHRFPHPHGQESFCSWMRNCPLHNHGDNADFPQCLHHFGHTKPFFIFSLSSFSYLGSFLSPSLDVVHVYPKRKTTVLGDPVSFHPVTLCRANHSCNLLTVKLLLSLFFSTKFSHNNPLSYFLPIKYMNS